MSLARGPEWPAEKEQARNALLLWRRNLSSLQRDELTQALSLRLKHYLSECRNPKSDVQCLAVYWPIRGEPDLNGLYRELTQMGYELALPVTPSSPAPLRFVRWRLGESMNKDSMGIATPISAQTVQPDLMLIPCVGYGPNRIRLGYGGGYYDRTLANFSGQTIGAAFGATFVKSLTAQSHDRPLECIMTESGET